MLFQIQTVFHKFNLNYDIQQIIFYHIFSYYSSIIAKYYLSFFDYKQYLINNISNFNKITTFGYIYYDVFDQNVSINFYRLSKIINNKYDLNYTFRFFVYLRDFFILKDRPWNFIKYDKNNVFYKMSKLSLKIFYKKYLKFNI